MEFWAGQQARGASLCNFEDEDGCYFYFTYRYNGRQSTGSDSSPYDIYVQRQKQCPPPPPVLGELVYRTGEEAQLTWMSLRQNYVALNARQSEAWMKERQIYIIQDK